MFIQSTLFDDRTPALPGGIKIGWQGVGEDAGYTVVSGHVGGDAGWFVINSLGGTLSATTTIDGNEDAITLHPRLNYPDVWWNGGNWCATPNSIDSPSKWTLVRTPLTHWHPREWEFQYLSAQGAEDLSAVEMRWYGDTWFDEDGDGRGALHTNSAAPGSSAASGVASANYTYTWAGYKHSGKGTAPAGEYRIPGSDAKMNVGYWDEENKEYTLELSGHSKTAPVRMMQLGLLRVPSMDGHAPTSWSFLGAKWDDPDPFDWRYWHCIRCALIERESVIESVIDGTRDLGTLVGGEDALWQISPLTPPNLNCIRTMRDLIVALSKEYIDIDRAGEVVRGGGMPTKGNTHIPIDGYPHIVGGWDRGDPLRTDALRGFLKESREVLRKMTVTTSPWVVFNAYKTGWMAGAGWAREDDGETFDNAWNEAIDDYTSAGEEFGRHWVYWTRSRGNIIPNGWSSSIIGRSGAEDRNGELEWEVQFGNWQTAVSAIPHPPTSVLDGDAMAVPKCLYCKNSVGPDVEPGDPYDNGIVRDVTYYSGITASGFEMGLADFPMVWEEEPPTSPVPAPSPSGQYQMEWNVWGNDTSWYLYVSWAHSFRFDGIDIAPGDGGENAGDDGGEEP